MKAKISYDKVKNVYSMFAKLTFNSVCCDSQSAFMIILKQRTANRFNHSLRKGEELLFFKASFILRKIILTALCYIIYYNIKLIYLLLTYYYILSEIFNLHFIGTLIIT